MDSRGWSEGCWWVFGSRALLDADADAMWLRCGLLMYVRAAQPCGSHPVRDKITLDPDINQHRHLHPQQSHTIPAEVHKRHGLMMDVRLCKP